MLKIFSKLAIAVMAVALGVSIPSHYAPAMAAGETRYISEVRVGIGKTEDEAKSELLAGGYTILSKDGKYADLNYKAGSDAASARGQKIVYLGYKTTTDAKEAITDLAVMNMRGGYSVKDYEELMENKLKVQIIPFVERFIVTLQEYRDNLDSPYASNKARAQYMKSMLNNLTDDDTGGLMGDLLANETKYELGDAAYAALSEEEKKQHADILTILMQANGKATLSMETFLTKATDTAETSWIDRLEDNSLDNLRQELEDNGVDITEVDTTLDRMYGDDAKKLLEKWDTFSKALNEYDEKANALANYGEHEYDEQFKTIDQFDENSKNYEKNNNAVVTCVKTGDELASRVLDLELVAAKERMDEVEYDFDDGATLAEFFAQDASVFNGEGIRNLYPIVASLSAGQIAGLDFLSLQDLVTIATADATSYQKDQLGDIEPASIFEGVNREIFEKGKVAVTNKALRAEAMQNDGVSDHPLSASTYVLYGATALATAGMILAWKGISYYKNLYAINNPGLVIHTNEDELVRIGSNEWEVSPEVQQADANRNAMLKSFSAKSEICTYLTAAFTVAMAILAAFSIYSTIKDLLDYYKVDYTPIPKYIVEETDITEEVNGVKTVVRNDSAYYQVAECNRKPDADFYEQLQNYADLNGDVGKQWLALYYVRQDGHAPIKADSLKVVTGTNSIPSGYTELGIHDFETTSAYNLTSKYYCYNDPNNGTYVYFQLDEAVLKRASVAGSNFSTGTAFLFSGIGLAVGAGIGIAIMLFLNKRKEKAVQE